MGAEVHSKTTDLANRTKCDTIISEESKKIYSESEYMDMLREAFELISKLPNEKLKEIMEGLK